MMVYQHQNVQYNELLDLKSVLDITSVVILRFACTIFIISKSFIS